ncbi:MAG: hypothetical protein QW041_02570 [Candidatus Pacearchaeota archaeon]
MKRDFLVILIIVLLFLVAGINNCVLQHEENKAKIKDHIEILGLSNYSSKEISNEFVSKEKKEMHVNPLDFPPEQTIGYIESPTLFSYPIWYSNNLKYSYLGGCDDARKKVMKDAFSIVEKYSDNLIKFNEEIGNENADILIYCSSSSEAPETERHWKILGEGGPVQHYPINGYNIITKGVIFLYEYQCSNEASSGLHELLHVLGFNHVNKSGDIMYPKSNCLSEVKNHTKDSLKKIYSIFNKFNTTSLL